MNKYLPIVLSIIVLVGVVAGSIFGIRALNESLKNYKSPLQQVVLPSQTSALPKRADVVVVLISGLGYDSAQTLNLPVLSQLAQTGANAAIQSFPPTYSQTSQTTLITGAPPETNMAPPVDRPLEELSLVGIDSIFAQAHRRQLKTALLGTAHWQRLIPRNHLDETFFINTTGPEADQAIVEAALTLLKNDTPDLVFIHLTQLYAAARTQGGAAGNAYNQAAGQIDNHLVQLSRATDLNNQVLVILSDHGFTSSGGNGGDEVEVVWQPLVMVGSQITPGSYSDIYQTDIAPTITTLLGTSPPAATQGRILFEMLRLNEHDRAVAQIMLTQQRIALAKAYLAQVIGTDASSSDRLLSDLSRAQADLIENNVAGAYQLALLTQKEADTTIAATRLSQIKAEQWPRLVIAALVAGIWGFTLWRRRGNYAGLIIAAAIITISLYHILYQIQGYNYSLSSLNNLDDLAFDAGRRAGVSFLAGGGLILIILMLIQEKDWLILLGTGYGFGVFVAFIFALPFLWAYWQNGVVVEWYLPAVGPLFWQITALYEMMVAAILGLIIPWPIMFLSLVVNRVRQYLDEGQPHNEPDALPGLHL